MTRLDLEMAGPAGLEVEGVSVHFGGLRALSEVSLTVAPGEVVGLIGPNGAGKTTLFNAVSGFVKVDSGHIRMGDVELTRTAPWRRANLGLVRTFQQGGVVKGASVMANVVMAQHARMHSGVTKGILGLAAAEERELAARAVEVVGRLSLDRVAGTPVVDLSHGLQKTVGVACAIVRQPRLLLLDEPSAGLDPAETTDLAGRLADLQRDVGFSALVIDHDLRLVRHLARHIVVLSFGQVIAAGDWDSVRADPQVVGAYLGPQAAGEGDGKEGESDAPARAG